MSITTQWAQHASVVISGEGQNTKDKIERKKKNTVQPSGLFLFAISAHVSGPLRAHWPTIRLIPHLFYQPVFSAHLHLCLIYNCSSPPGSVNLGHSFAGPLGHD